MRSLPFRRSLAPGGCHRARRLPELLRPGEWREGTSRGSQSRGAAGGLYRYRAATGDPPREPSVAVVSAPCWHCVAVSLVSSDCSTAPTMRTSAAPQSPPTVGARWRDHKFVFSSLERNGPRSAPLPRNPCGHGRAIARLPPTHLRSTDSHPPTHSSASAPRARRGFLETNFSRLPSGHRAWRGQVVECRRGTAGRGTRPTGRALTHGARTRRPTQPEIWE
jgi:hypothetical protein